MLWSTNRCGRFHRIIESDSLYDVTQIIYAILEEEAFFRFNDTLTPNSRASTVQVWSIQMFFCGLQEDDDIVPVHERELLLDR